MAVATPSDSAGRRRPRRRPGENRAGLIAAGTIEFGLHGYAAAQTSAIASRAGVSQPNVYANFSSKRDLFLACVRELTASLTAELATTPTDEHTDGRADDQRTADQRAVDQRTADQRTADQRTADQRTADQRTVERRTADQRTAVGAAIDEARLLLLFQAYAACRDEQLATELAPLLRDARTALGAAVMDFLVVEAAEALLGR